MPRSFRFVALGLGLYCLWFAALAQAQQERAGGRGAPAANRPRDLRPRSQSPYVDVTQYGARAVNQTPATTGSIAAGSNRVNVLSGSGFLNGDGIVVRGAGAGITLRTPGAPVVTASAAVFTGTGLTV